DEISQTRRPGGPLLDRLEDTGRRRNADVGRQQELFERVDCFDIDGARALPWIVGLSDDLIETIANLLLGSGETVAETTEETHPRHLTSGHPGAWRRALSLSGFSFRALPAKHQRVQRGANVGTPREHVG